MSQLHVVQPGDHASSIAAKYGFADFATIWNHEQNEELRKKRRDPNVLAPGDQIYIPDFSSKAVEVAAGKRHVFVVHAVPTLLKLRLLDAVGEPIANAKGELDLGEKKLPVSTDGDGLLEVKIPSTARRGTLKLEELVYELAIGHLDPEDTPVGAAARLVNLGYRFVEPDQLSDNRRPELHFATELFAHDRKVKLDGEVKAFLDKLRQAHGS